MPVLTLDTNNNHSLLYAVLCAVTGRALLYGSDCSAIKKTKPKSEMENLNSNKELSTNTLNCPDLDLICGQLSQHFTLCVPVDAEVFYLQLLLSEELLHLQIQTQSHAKTRASPESSTI